MPDRLTVADRVTRLEREYKQSGKTQKDLAESLGVSPRTVRRWKNKDDVPMPRTSNSGKASQLSRELSEKLPALDYGKFRRREKYEYHEAPEREADRAVEDTPQEELPPDEVEVPRDRAGLLLEPEFGFDLMDKLNAHPELRDAINDGEEIVFALDLTDDDMERHREFVKIDASTPAEFVRQYHRAIRGFVGDGRDLYGAGVNVVGAIVAP